MLLAEPRALLRKLDSTCTRALEAAAGACIGSSHYEVTVEHMLLALLDDRHSDVTALFEHYRIDLSHARSALQHALSDMRSGNPGKPTFSTVLLEWVQDAWLFASTELSDTSVRSGALLVRLVMSPSKYVPYELPVLENIPRDDIRQNLAQLAANSGEAQETLAAAPRGAGDPGRQAKGAATALGKADGPLARFTSDLTARAKAGEIDPVFGRESEVRQVVDILVRRRKNNPIIVGEAGVGKTALVEGLAVRIAEGTVPDQLKDVSILALDLGALQAGAGVKGEFENRLKGVINEVKASPRPIVLFIDEAHTLIGAGNAQGGGDAANLLKPALARGELRTIAATTFAEFKKYFEKDPALERRFQPVKVDEPSTETAILMLRGVAEKFQAAHGVVITDAAVRAAVDLSSRYISGRQLPDKAVDLLDTSAARAKVMRAAPPGELEDTRAQLAAIERELGAMKRDHAAGHNVDEEAKEKAERRRGELVAKASVLETRMGEQRAIVDRIMELRKEGKSDDASRAALRAELDRLDAIKPEELMV
ncbi:MAG: AAA family ATPase, partial [Polyangiales bacterium]